MNGLTDFYRNWEDYKYRFGNPNDEYWLGISNLHHLTKNRHCQLRIDLVNWDNLARYAEYEQFSIGDENDGYRLSIGSYSGNAGGVTTGKNRSRGYPNELKKILTIISTALTIEHKIKHRRTPSKLEAGPGAREE
ncbi:hypothetical protein FSP39_011479 [Pinctada imbricata]|uniref:Fibrinogen C-terminal domain-containing protein n=1 Tax=Pinctada imbricata TaxID=66713 RepID=A0AA89C7B6_PINIB|nr:hypothetical protein FSP39_011479 [Pinctada imbricata]